MNTYFINITSENLANEHLCCIIRSKVTHSGVEAKRQWLADRLTEGHVFRKLKAKATVFIEYAPLETAWVPIIGDNYIYYDMQCPFVYQTIEVIRQYCETHDIPVYLIQVGTLQEAKELPCVFNNWAVFYKGKFETVNLLSIENLKKILKK